MKIENQLVLAIAEQFVRNEWPRFREGAGEKWKTHETPEEFIAGVKAGAVYIFGAKVIFTQRIPIE